MLFHKDKTALTPQTKGLSIFQKSPSLNVGFHQLPWNICTTIHTPCRSQKGAIGKARLCSNLTDRAQCTGCRLQGITRQTRNLPTLNEGKPTGAQLPRGTCIRPMGAVI